MTSVHLRPPTKQRPSVLGAADLAKYEDPAERFEDPQGGVYSCVRPQGESLAYLKHLASLVSFVEPETDDLHCTVLYSFNENRIPVSLASPWKYMHKALIDKFLIWKGHNDENYLVCLLFSPDLRRANDAWQRLGFTITMPEYRPHITFKGKINHPRQQEALTILNNLVRDDLVLEFGSEIITPLEK